MAFSLPCLKASSAKTGATLKVTGFVPLTDLKVARRELILEILTICGYKTEKPGLARLFSSDTLRKYSTTHSSLHSTHFLICSYTLR